MYVYEIESVCVNTLTKTGVGSNDQSGQGGYGAVGCGIYFYEEQKHKHGFNQRYCYEILKV